MKQMMVMLTLTLLVSSVRAEVFRDNFNDGDLKGWTFLQGAEDGGIENGELVLSSPRAEHEAEVMSVVDGITARDYEVAVSLKISRLVRNINGGPLIGLRAHTPPILEPLLKEGKLKEGTREREKKKEWIQTLWYRQSYQFLLGNQDINIQDIRRGLAANIEHVEFDKQGIFHKRNLRAFQLFDFRLHKWYRLKVIAKGNRFQYFIDDTKMLDFLDDTYAAGRIYLSSGLGNRVHFDDFEVQYEALSVQPREKLTTSWGEIKSSFH